MFTKRLAIFLALVVTLGMVLMTTDQTIAEIPIGTEGGPQSAPVPMDHAPALAEQWFYGLLDSAGFTYDWHWEKWQYCSVLHT